MGLLPYVKEKNIIVKNGKPHFIYNNKPWIGWIGFSFLLRLELITKVGTEQKESSGE
jgi:hypothetical protein